MRGPFTTLVLHVQGNLDVQRWGGAKGFSVESLILNDDETISKLRKDRAENSGSSYMSD